MMRRAVLYCLAMLALLIAIFLLVVFAGMGLYGMALVRSDAFGLFLTSYILIGVPAALVLAVWLARRPKAPD